MVSVSLSPSHTYTHAHTQHFPFESRPFEEIQTVQSQVSFVARKTTFQHSICWRGQVKGTENCVVPFRLAQIIRAYEFHKQAKATAATSFLALLARCFSTDFSLSQEIFSFFSLHRCKVAQSTWLSGWRGWSHTVAVLYAQKRISMCGASYLRLF